MPHKPHVPLGLRASAAPSLRAGLAMGFPAQKALDIVYNMLYGSLLLLQQSQQHLAVLKWQIASPQGTTIAGLRKMEELALRGAIMNTFLAAFKRE